MNILGMGSRFGLSDFEQIAIVGVLVAAFISLLYAWYPARWGAEEGQRHRQDAGSVERHPHRRGQLS